MTSMHCRWFDVGKDDGQIEREIQEAASPADVPRAEEIMEGSMSFDLESLALTMYTDFNSFYRNVLVKGTTIHYTQPYKCGG